MPEGAQGSVTERTPAEKDMKDEEILKIYHGGSQVAYERGHRAGHREGWDQGVTVVHGHDNEFLRGLEEQLVAENSRRPSLFVENLLSTIRAKRRHNTASIEIRKGRA